MTKAMTKTARKIKNYSIITIRALTTLVLGLCVLAGASVLLVLQTLSWPFAYIATKCSKAARDLHLVDFKTTT